MVTRLLGTSCTVQILLLPILFKKRSVHIFERVPKIFQIKHAVYKTIVKRFYMIVFTVNYAYMHGNEYKLDVS